MKNQKITRFIIFLNFWLFSITAFAGPAIDTLAVQGYMKKANGAAVTDGTYNLAIGVRQNDVTIWAKQYPVSIVNGLFSKNLSGSGSNLTTLGAGTGLNADYSAVTLNSALLLAGGNGAVVVRIYAMDAIDGANPQFDITLASVPTAFVCNVAQSVAAGSITLAGLATAAMTATSAGGADAGKLVLLNGSGLIDTSMIPTLSVAQGGTGGTSASAARANMSAAASGVNNDITSITGLTTALTIAQGGTGSTTKNFVDLSTDQTAIGGNKTFTGAVTASAAGTGLSVTNNATISGTLAVTGDLTVNGASGGVFTNGLKLKASGAGSTVLSHYEEGTFTPAYAGTSTAGSCTYTTQSGNFVRIGKLVYFTIKLKWTACSPQPAGAPFLITNLPYAANAAAAYQNNIQIQAITSYTISTSNLFVGRVPASGTSIELKQVATGTSSVITDVAVDTAADLVISGTYYAN